MYAQSVKERWITAKEDSRVPFQFPEAQDSLNSLTFKVNEEQETEGWMVCPTAFPCRVCKLVMVKGYYYKEL